MDVAITGGAGFIGANLAATLVSSDFVDRLVIVDDLSTGFQENLVGIDGAELLEGSILDPALLDRAFLGAGAVVHLAARSSVPRSVAEPLAAHAANATGTAEVLEAVRRAGGPHLIVASSSSVYGANPALPKHESLATQPVNPYGATKLATEAYSLAWAAAYGLDVLAFRFFNVFGPLQPPRHTYAAVVPAFLSALMEGHPLPVHGDGRQTRDFTYVGSVCTVIADALRRRVTSATAVNLAFGSRVSLLRVIADLEAIVGESLLVEHQPPRPGDVRDTQADTTRLRELFPDADPIGLTEGLRATVDWFRSRT
ncbi:MAG: NAD-dependent epimerase/dehydratase family protein [Actinomycetota bacterium]|nr:NAD-dependent epimerase/dehydratase family protein [Actinomycetota bacterium]